MTVKHLVLSLLFLPFALLGQPEKTTEKTPKTIGEKTAKMTFYKGFYDFYWDEEEGKIWLLIDRLNEEFLYVNSLPAGVGSNDIGLDRGQLGDNRVVYFFKSGNKILLVQPNYNYRAVSDNLDEQKSVREAFAQSVLWGFKVEISENGRYLVDATEFFLQDAHGVTPALERTNQGKYQLDKTRSVIYLENTKNFPLNSEFEALLTFTGEAKGAYIKSVTPTAAAVSVRQRHSFIQLPDAAYQPRAFDPRSGYFSIAYQDYATPISSPLVKQFIVRHRLEKKDPNAAMSEALEPIIYYVDRGAPEPIRSALIEGASWWNEAFEAAGYKNAFQVKVLPEGADPMDVRYNVIQWVHRSTRGWSYGSSVIDPRTGEIIKGHVSLGSLRVRQDYLIAQGLLSPFGKDGPGTKPLEEMALARLRQLSAHEVGHTIGLAHNFAASTNNRASVMDYPHPYVRLTNDGLDFSQAYDTGIGEWDKRAIIYGYTDFPTGKDEAEALSSILQETLLKSPTYISDEGARPMGSAHPNAHLWDNGNNPIVELNRIMVLRAYALEHFGENTIPEGTPMAELENVLVPVYLMHRYQIEAVAKLIGGLDYTYAVKGDGQIPTQIVPTEKQQQAVEALLSTLSPSKLVIPEHILKLIPPQPQGYSRGRENFKTNTGLTFDPLAAAESLADVTFQLLFHPQRASRLVEYHVRDKNNIGLEAVIDMAALAVWELKSDDDYLGEMTRIVQTQFVKHLIALAADESASYQVRAIARAKLLRLRDTKIGLKDGFALNEANMHIRKILQDIQVFEINPQFYKPEPSKPMPAGSPIGCDH